MNNYIKETLEEYSEEFKKFENRNMKKLDGSPYVTFDRIEFKDYLTKNFEQNKAFLQSKLEGMVVEIESKIDELDADNCHNTSSIFNHNDYYKADEIKQILKEFK